MRRQAAQCSKVVIIIIPPFGSIISSELVVTDSAQCRQCDVGGIGGVEHRLEAVFSAGQRHDIYLFELIISIL